MPRAAEPSSRRFAFRPLAVAAAAALALTFSSSLPATAQTYYAWADATNPVPTDATDPNFSFGSLQVGNGAAGSFSALAGAQMTGDRIQIGSGLTGNGSVGIAGNSAPSSTLVQLTGTGLSRVQVGNWGTGSMTVSAGASVDAAGNSAVCVSGVNCGVIVGNGAGSNGTLTITGTSSELRAIQYFLVGSPNASPGFGTPGGRADGTVNVQSGGTLSTQGAVVGNYNPDTASTHNESAYGTVTVSGTGSKWQLGSNPVTAENAYLLVG
jgi:hypothetical protein